MDGASTVTDDDVIVLAGGRPEMSNGQKLRTDENSLVYRETLRNIELHGEKVAPQVRRQPRCRSTQLDGSRSGSSVARSQVRVGADHGAVVNKD